VSAGPAAGDETEALLLAILRRFEALALAKYEAHAPALAGPEKRAFVAALGARAPGPAPLGRSELASAVEDLLAHADLPDAASTLLVQGLVLERLGHEIYGALVRSPRASPALAALAREGRAAAAETLAALPALLAREIGSGETLFTAFVARTGEVLRRLDALGEEIDRAFGARFELRFADILGGFVAEMIPASVALGMSRRKVVCHLAGALMKGALDSGPQPP
jgi:hypothetical protein